MCKAGTGFKGLGRVYQGLSDIKQMRENQMRNAQALTKNSLPVMPQPKTQQTTATNALTPNTGLDVDGAGMASVYAPKAAISSAPKLLFNSGGSDAAKVIR